MLVYYSGHGVLDDAGNGYLAPLDTDPANIAGTCYPTSDLRAALAACPAKQKILILDCCHAGGAKDAAPVGASGEEIGSAFRKAAGLITLASCKKQELSHESDEFKQGVFTYFLAEGLGGKADRDRDGIVSSDELYQYVFDKVPTLARQKLGKDQHPTRLIGEDVVGVFALAKVTLPEGVGEVLPLGVTRAVFTVREETDAGRLAAGAEIELFWRKTAASPLTALGSVTTDSQGRAALDVKLSLAQRAGGQFLASVSRDGRSLDAALKNFPANPNVKLYAPARSKEPKAGEVTVNSVGMKLAYIPAGEFWMGSSETASALALAYAKYGAKEEHFSDEYPRHRVKLTRGYRLGVYEVTVAQFRRFVTEEGYRTEAERDGKGGYGWEGTTWKQDPKYTWQNAGFSQTDDHPVVNVSWNDAAAYCAWLTRKEGQKYRLPTEAEWEYACRGETTTRYSFGDDPEALASHGNVADGTAKERFSAWTWAISARDGYVFTAPVGKYRANQYNLLDMHGNVCEWCGDGYDSKYYGTLPELATDPTGPSGGSNRVYRGGGWYDEPRLARSAYRDWDSPADRIHDLGFRVAQVPGS